VPEWCQLLFDRVRERCLSLQHLAPGLGSALILAASFCPSRPLRFLCLSVGIILLLFVAADFARSLLDRETGNASYQGPPAHIPVTALQLFLALIVATTYFCMILAGLHTLFLASATVTLIMAPGILVYSLLAAWRNVRLWYREGANHKPLKEEENQTQRLHIPPVH
jgi:hypothetical protein